MTEGQGLLGIGSRVKHPAYGDGVVVALHPAAYDVSFILYGIKSVGKDYEKWEVLEAIPPESEITFSAMEKSLVKILRYYSGFSEITPLGDKWEGGTLILKPGDESLKPKEMPVETFFHKVVMVRDRLRVMEQRINSSSLSDEDKVNLQQYITRIYGSLTSFNILFKHKEDHFVGDKKGQ